MEYIVNLPVHRKFKSVCQIREPVLYLEQAMMLAREFRRWFISGKIGSFESNQITSLETRVVTFPSVVGLFRDFL
jgi:hypothetical protein